MIDKLWLMEIEKFALKDGPGIRSTIFFQGCPMRCLWCSNPESWTLGKKLYHYKNKCVKCGSCVRACVKQLITVNEQFNCQRDLCDGCGDCVIACPKQALKLIGKQYSVEQIVNEVEKDEAYYQISGGGITISGGEPFSQFTGFSSLLTALKAKEYYVIVETTLQTKTENVLACVDSIDLFYVDIKHYLANKLWEVCRGDLPLILSNLSAVKEKTVVRIPVIPNFNHDTASMKGIFQLIKGYGIKEVQLLPYHSLGKAKYQQLQIPYPLDVGDLKDKDLLIWLDLASDYGLSASINY